MSPTFAFLTFGCRLNQAESSEWHRTLLAQGYTEASPEEAALICIHSCAVTATAQHEVERTLRKLRMCNPSAKILLSGCAATLLPLKLSDARLPHAEKAHFLKTAESLLIPHSAFRIPNSQSAASPAIPHYELRIPNSQRTRASLIVQDGCDRYCAYCIVPHMRGKPTSEPLDTLLKKARHLIAEGYAEIVITGCHLALYQDAGTNLLGLLQRLCDLPGETRFRLGSIEPCTLDDHALIRFIAQSRGKVCDFLHFPIQTASDTLLRSMRRTYTSSQIRSLLDTLFSELPLCGVSADWIVGLPGETDDDAAATEHLLRSYPFIGAHIFPYSPRPGTPAATFPHQVPQHLQKRRLDALHASAHEVRAKALRRYLHQPLTVIPERSGEGWASQYVRCCLPPTAQRGVPFTFTPTHIENGKLQ